jgi:electron transfer flavoprotein beta subunit
MRTLVCIKYVPETSEKELKINAAGTAVDCSSLSFVINDADSYAVEKRCASKRKHGGSVALLTIGSKESEGIIRMAMAKGCDNAVRVEDPRIAAFDPLMSAKVLAAVARDLEFDLILTGCMAADDGDMAAGVALAEELGVPHASMVKGIKILDGKAEVSRELEGGLMEVVEVSLPAVLTIQTGINELRYASIRGILEAQKKELKTVGLDELGIAVARSTQTLPASPLRTLHTEVVSNANISAGAPIDRRTGVHLCKRRLV